MTENHDSSTAHDPSEKDGFADGRTLVIGLRGWNDAGDAASDAVSMVRRHLADRSELLWNCDDEVFFDYSLHRPMVQFNGGEREIVWPNIVVTGPKNPDERGDDIAADAGMRISASNSRIYVMSGVEPTLRWKTFAKRVIEFVDEHEITRIVLVGALLADAPHTRPIPVYASSDDAIVRDELGVSRSEYEGPTGILGIISAAIRERDDLRALSLWASVPHYAHSSPSPKAVSALLDKLEELLDLSIPRSELLSEVETWEAEINEMTAEDEDLVRYISFLESTYDTVEAPEASGEAIAREFERFLEQSQPQPPKGQASHPSTRRLSQPRATDEQITPDARVNRDDEDGQPGTQPSSGDLAD